MRVQIVDAQRGDSIDWTRCGEGTLGTLAAAGSGVYGVRLVEAARILRNFTVSRRGDFVSSYFGSLPLRTLVRGEQARAPLLVPRVIEEASAWASFWSEYISTSKPIAPVDFSTEVVLVGAVGTRQEAGDSVEVRAVLQVTFGTQVNLKEQRLGDFCTPARRKHTPFHIVAAPMLLKPIFFSLSPFPDLIRCG